MSGSPRAEPRGGRAILPLAAGLLLIGVVLAAALMLLLVAVLGGDGTTSPEGTVGSGALPAMHPFGTHVAGAAA